jgi:TATA-binding protein-associated factor Taf7
MIDSLAPKFREWLCHLGAGSYVTSFFNAGYDMKFISENGLNDEDLDCVGIPHSKLGLRRKLIKLHKLDEFFVREENSEESNEEGEDGSGDDEDEENSVES